MPTAPSRTRSAVVSGTMGPPAAGMGTFATRQCGGFDEDTKTNWTGSTCCHAGFICSEAHAIVSTTSTRRRGGPFMPYKPTKALEEPSDAPVFTFYVYRASSEEGSDLLDNINVGNLAGTLWYLQNEVVFVRPRKFNISKIVRYKISTKSTTPLYDLGMNFGVRFAYDSAQCDGPWSCDLNYDRFGYFVGCNNLGSFPFPTYDIHYPGAKWYALPGPCSSKTYQDKDAKCIKEQPGGRCDGTPTGQGRRERGASAMQAFRGVEEAGEGNCTYSIEVVGSLTIDEIDGIKDYHEFIHTGGVEFNKTLDKGEGCTFWNNMNVTAKNIERVEKVRALFEKKYPDQPLDEDMEAPACDFNFTAFYGKDPSYLTTTAAPTTEAATTEAPTTTTTEAETTETATTEAETTEAETTEAETTEAETTKTALSTPAGCKDAEFGTHCYSAVTWAKEHGLKLHPTWYPGLTSSSPFSDFQARVHHVNPKDCPLPCTKDAGCHTAVAGEHCYSAVKWAAWRID
ncbi:Carbohydrate-binding domain-containing protein C2E1P3.05c [Durusdinium trenchii]|uniref:Carbohydrate-binding domain-containing protein C2E1P3.05c n=1 Tax=Durusdinium trenchii TaxID=1381693 RepID=A0ABP0KK33_9DINO